MEPVSPARRRLLGLALLQALAPAVALAQADEGADESHVKAAFVYKFTGYVDWPERAFDGPDAPFVIGVLGTSPLLGELSQLTAGRKVRERAIVVRKVVAGEAAAPLHLLFVGRAQAWHGDAAAARPVLIVTEAEGAMPRGSMINFLIVDRRVRFEIALPSVERAGLRMSSRLLAVAQHVIQGEER
ncbi:YfiR family protein [Pelomonas sp. KK5]|uniref:YfiR family protein n=1 Tax=Pelomonas sp. KK5 TaxID=1855730 RepID=UPI00097C7B6E|nr:YfiR family protein [Pelomonas sp. KK5]